MRVYAVVVAVLLLLLVFPSSISAGEVALYTGNVNWMSKEMADAEAQICASRLTAAGITVTWFSDPADEAEGGPLQTWVKNKTGNGELDVLVLYGRTPTSLYPAGNAQPDNSVLELFIETTDGDAVMNHGDWMFYVSSPGSPNNGPGGLQNIMDIPGIGMGGDNTPMVVTDEGKEITPNLSNFLSDRPLAINQLAGDWFPEVIFAQNADGTRADPCIVRDGELGRIIPAFMTNSQNDPKGAVAAEIIAYLMGVELVPNQVTISGHGITVTGTPVKLSIALVDAAGVPTPAKTDVTVNLATSTGTGAFDTVWLGAYDGSLTSVTIPTGQAAATVYYKDTAAGTVTLTASDADGALSQGELNVEVLQDQSGPSGEVAVFTGRVGWIDEGAAAVQAQICIDKLSILGISTQWFQDPGDEDALRDWVVAATGNGKVDVLVLYGYCPPTLYPCSNAQPDGSVAESFIESTDGDLILNHGDYMFYVCAGGNNEVGGLQNMMDIAGISMWGDNTPVAVTDVGREIAPSLSDFLTDRPFHINELSGQWFVEAALAVDTSGTRADPVIVRDGNRGRLGIAFQTAAQDDPKGAVAAEIIAWLYGFNLGEPYKLALLGRAVGLVGQPVKLTVQIQDLIGSPTAEKDTPTVVNLQSSSATGAFDVAPDGAFDGSVTSVTVPEHQDSVEIYYKDTAGGTPTLTATAEGLQEGTLDVKIFERSFAPPGEVAMYTGDVWWISKEDADAQAQITKDRLAAVGIDCTIFASQDQKADLATWVTSKTNNGQLDVLILYGDFPDSIYPSGNAQPDGSIAELFIESTDGDVIMNHADWMFYGQGRNGPGGLQNMMDIPGIVFGTDNTPMKVTEEGRAIAPSLKDFLSDRPFRLNQLAGNWLAEVVLAESEDGTQADPVILRDGDLGRLIPVYQTNQQADPKGAVAAEIIAYLMGKELLPTRAVITGPTVTVTRTPLKLEVSLADEAGIPTPSAQEVTITLASDSASGAFDTVWDGNYDGTVTSVTIPAGQAEPLTVYYRDTQAGSVILTASAEGLTAGQLEITVLQGASVTPGQVAIYTGVTSWITKALADAEAQICVDALNAAGIPNVWFTSTDDEAALAQWVQDATGNGQLDVLVLYGYLPPSIYPGGNTQPDGSIAELFIESTDGDAIINHADYMFYVSNPLNGTAGLENMMDITGISMWGDNTPMSVTYEGSKIAPSLTDFLSDRPFHVYELAGQWFVEAVLAQNADGSLADPIIVRDGNRGRLIPAFQTADQQDPKGQVAAEIITWLMAGAVTAPQFVRGDSNASGGIDIADAIYTLSYLFGGGELPPCMDAADANDDGGVDIGDAISTLAHLFGGAGDLPPPFPACGEDPTEDPLDCESFAPCE